MKVKFHYAALALISLVAVMSSCSKDDKNDGPDEPDVKMVLTEMRGGYVNLSGIPETGFAAKYDSKGRVIEFTPINNDHYSYQFSYSDNRINCTIFGEDVTYDIVDGKIVKDSDGRVYTYDGNDQLVKVADDEGVTSLSWSSGNITAASDNWDGEIDKWTLSYSDKANVGNLNYALNVAFSTCYPSEGGWLEVPLALSGYFGKVGKNLCTCLSISGHLDRTIEYSDYNSNGYPQTLKITDSDGDVQLYTLTWTKL